MINFPQILTQMQIAFGVAIIAFAVVWYVFVRQPEKSKKNTNKS